MSYVQVYFNGELKFTAPLKPKANTIGRAASNDVVIDNAGVSGLHAIISQDGNEFFIEDVNSTNGVFVNGRRISREPLRYGDEIIIYKHKLKFTAVDLSMDKLNTAKPKPAFTSQGQTMEVNVAQLQAILQHQQTQAPYLLQTGGNQQHQGRKWMLSKQYFDIGKSRGCDLRVGGWFTPKLTAKIIRQSDGYYIIPEKWGKVRLNGTPLSGRIKLQNLDKLQVRDIALTFYQPATHVDPAHESH